MEQKFKDAEARFRAHRKTVEKEAETCHMIEAAEARAIVLRDRKLQEMSNKGTKFTIYINEFNPCRADFGLQLKPGKDYLIFYQ